MTQLFAQGGQSQMLIPAFQEQDCQDEATGIFSVEKFFFKLLVLSQLLNMNQFLASLLESIDPQNMFREAKHAR